jgi:hypothetical protein
MEFYWGLAIGAIGALLGMFFALNGFGGPLKAEDLKNTARVRNLLWLVTGAAGVILADWKKLTASAPDAGFLLISYLLGAIAGAVLGLAAIVLFIAIDITVANRARSGSNRLPYGLVTDYLHYGYAYYQQMRTKHDDSKSAERDQIEQAVNEALQQANHDNLLRDHQERIVRLERDASVQNVIAGLVHGIAAVFAETDQGRRSERQREVVDAILEGVRAAIVNRSRSDVQTLRIAVNHMTFVPIGKASKDQIGASLFRFGDERRYTGLLVQHQAAAGSPQETVILPVDGRINDRDTLLPGAPEAFVLRKAAIINSQSVKCSRGIDQKTQVAIQRFFQGVDFASVASIPISGKDGPIGIINIESNRDDVLGEGEEVGKAACTTLQPFAALLSRMV